MNSQTQTAYSTPLPAGCTNDFNHRNTVQARGQWRCLDCGQSESQADRDARIARRYLEVRALRGAA